VLLGDFPKIGTNLPDISARPRPFSDRPSPKPSWSNFTISLQYDKSFLFFSGKNKTLVFLVWIHLKKSLSGISEEIEDCDTIDKTQRLADLAKLNLCAQPAIYEK
jgi:hypothetical protein